MDLNQVMTILESGDAIPEGDFPKILAQIELNLKEKYTLVPSYEEIFRALIDLAERNIQEKMSSDIWMKSQGDSCKIISFQLRGYLDEGEGFIPSDSEMRGEVLKPYELLHTAQDEVLRTVSNVIANYNSEKYNQGLIYLFADWIYWGQSCWWNNPDTVGGGDRVFLVTQDTIKGGQLHFSFISYPDSVSRLPLPISQLQSTTSIVQSVQVSQSNQTEKGLTHAIAIKFLGYSSDLVGTMQYAPNGEADALFMVKFGEDKVVSHMALLPDVETIPDEIIWTTDVGMYAMSDNRPLAVFTMSDGDTIGTKLNFADGTVNFDAPAGSCFGLIADISPVTQDMPGEMRYAQGVGGRVWGVGERQVEYGSSDPAQDNRPEEGNRERLSLTPYSLHPTPHPIEGGASNRLSFGAGSFPTPHTPHPPRTGLVKLLF